MVFASVVTGTLENVDYEDGFILVDSNQGLGCLRIDTIIAIKPGNPKTATVISSNGEARGSSRAPITEKGTVC